MSLVIIPMDVDKLQKKIEDLVVKLVRKDRELKQVKGKMMKRLTLSYYRNRFRGGK